MYKLQLVNCIIPVLFSDNYILTVLTCIFFVSTLLLAPLLSSSAPLTRRTTYSSPYVMHVANRISYFTYSETHCIKTFLPLTDAHDMNIFDVFLYFRNNEKH